MPCRLTELIVDCRDPDLLARFWTEVLGYEITDRDEEGVVIGGSPGSGPAIFFAVVPEAKAGKNRIHLDLNATDGDQAAEVARIKALGATEVDVGQGEQTWVVLADPEGNEFCVLRRTVPPVPAPLPLPPPEGEILP